MANSDYRVSLKFSEKDSDQTEVVKLLKQMGRRKSAFITKAVKFYLSENPDADIPGITSTTISKSSVKSILKELLAEMNFQEIQDLQNKNNEQSQKENEKNKENILNKQELKKDENIVDQISDEEVDNFLEGLEVWDMGDY